MMKYSHHQFAALPLFIAAAILFSLFAFGPSAFVAAQCVPDTLQKAIANPDVMFSYGFGVSVAADGNRIAVGAPGNDLQGINAGTAYVLEAATGAIIATLTPPTPASGDQFGQSIAISGNLVVVGEYGDDAVATDSGTAYVFNAITGALVATLNNPSPVEGDRFGVSVAIDGDAAVIGASGDDAGATDSGTAYVFNATTGALVATLNNPSPAGSDYFGLAVAVSGSVAVVGAPDDDTGQSGAGLAHAFNAATGGLIATFDNPSPGNSDQFGGSVAISGPLAVVGARLDDDGTLSSGAAYVFNAATGALVAILHNPAPHGGDYFGDSVAISGDVAVVGATEDNAGADAAGSAYVFDAATGALVATLDNPAPTASDQFGSAVAVSGSLVVVGAPQDDTRAKNAGSAYLFTCPELLPTPSPSPTGTPLPCVPDDLLHTLVEPVAGNFDYFASSIALSGNLAVAGASKRNLSSFYGVAYLYDAATGDLIRQLSDPEGMVDSGFGRSVAISGNVIVVGANEVPSEDNTIGRVGAAYVFDAATGGLIAKLINPDPTASDLFGLRVAVSGNLAVAGTYRDDAGATDAGTAYVFNATTGELVATLSNPSPAVDDNFGFQVAISGNLAVIGAHLDDTGAIDAGAAYVFNATTGELVATLNNPSPADYDAFGYSVSISGNLAVVGAYLDDAGATNAGAAYVFNVTTGALVATLNNPAPDTADLFGTSVAIDGDMAVVGAEIDDAVVTQAGAAFIFKATSGEMIARLDNPYPASGDRFGHSVAIDGNIALVGASTDATLADDGGSAYVFSCVAPISGPTATPTFTPTLSPTPSPTVTLTPTPTITPPPCDIPPLSESAREQIKSALLGLSAPSPDLDTNCDGIVDVADLLRAVMH